MNIKFKRNFNKYEIIAAVCLILSSTILLISFSGVYDKSSNLDIPQPVHLQQMKKLMIGENMAKIFTKR